MLEDDFTDVLRKAMVGHDLSSAGLARAADVTDSELADFQGGAFNPETARRVAAVLGLNTHAYVRHAGYRPLSPELPEIKRLDLPFASDRVNAWLISCGGRQILIDAGFDGPGLMASLRAQWDRLPERVFITHAHRDHTGALMLLLDAGVPVHAAGLPGTIAMHPGDRVCVGPLLIEACDLRGHANPALGYHIQGLSVPVLATGDALFAGSIGGCAGANAYRLALDLLNRTLAPLAGETELLPGHGPATTLVQERAANPFL